MSLLYGKNFALQYGNGKVHGLFTVGCGQNALLTQYAVMHQKMAGFFYKNFSFGRLCRGKTCVIMTKND